MKELMLALVFFVVGFSNAFAQGNEGSRGFVRFGVGTVDFENVSYNQVERGEAHYHEAAFTANFGLGYGNEYFRAIVLFDPAILDGVDGTSIISGGAKFEVGLPWPKWLKVGGGIMSSHNYTKLSNDAEAYKRASSDTVVSPFWSIVFLPRIDGISGFFADVRVGRSYGGDVIQPQTGKPVADSYISISMGAQLGFARFRKIKHKI